MAVKLTPLCSLAPAWQATRIVVTCEHSGRHRDRRRNSGPWQPVVRRPSKKIGCMFHCTGTASVNANRTADSNRPSW